MTLPEVLIAVTLMALITTVLSASIIVTLRSRTTTESKLNAAGSEQSIGLWMPADLSSALKILGGSATEQDEMIVCPGAGSHCPGHEVTGGSYAMLIQWRSLTDDEVSSGVNTRQYLYTNVAYYFLPAAGVIPGQSGVYELVRIECTNTVTVTGTSANVVSQWAVPGEGSNPGGGGWSCAGNVAARLDLTPAELSGWLPGEPVPPEVVRVTSALDPTATQDLVDESASLEDTTARRVMVTVNSGGAEGATTISITAGGSYRDELPAISMQNAPDFVAARSRCGGPLTLVIDKSNSITTPTNYSSSLRDSVRAFVETLIGTPVRLQFVMFGSKAAVVSPNAANWSYYYDLSDTSPGGAVEQLLGTPNASGQFPVNGGLLRSTTGGVFASGEFSGQYTNWEDGLLRAIRTANGSVPQVMPRTIVFFTDGIPTTDRSFTPGTTYSSSSVSPLVPADDPAWNAYQSLGTTFYQDAFNRANYWADLVRGPVDMVGVYVGPTNPTTATSVWSAKPQGYIINYQERTNWTYQMRQTWTYESNLDFESAPLSSTVNFQQGTTHQSQLDFEKATTFQAGRDYESKVDFEYRTSSGGNWGDATPAQYFGASTSNRRIGTATNRSWADVTAEQYWANLTLQNTSYWRDNGTRTYESVSEALYNARNTTDDESDRWRPDPNGWSDIQPTEYHAGVTGPSAHRHKYRINSTRTFYNVTATEFANYRTLYGTAADWRFSGWTDRTPTQYHNGNTTADETDGWRISGTRSSYTVTSAEYVNFRTVYGSTSNWSIGSWSDVTPTVSSPSTYNANNITADQNDGWRINGTRGSWYAINAGDYTTYNTTGNETDGYRKRNPSGNWVATTEADYNVHNTTSAETDGYRKVPTGFPNPSDATNPWKPSDAATFNANRYSPSGAGSPAGEAASGYRQLNQDDSANPTNYYPPVALNSSTPNIDILGRLVAGSDQYVLGQPDGSGNYATNADVYAGTWAQIGGALVKIALGECGGTLTLATQNGNSYVSSPFQYQESINQTTRTTNVQDTAVTFDFDFPDGLAKTVDVVPVNLTSLTGFSPASAHPWSCRAGARVLNEGEHFWVAANPVTPGWPKLTVRVGANEAVSCSQQVVQH